MSLITPTSVAQLPTIPHRSRSSRTSMVCSMSAVKRKPDFRPPRIVDLMK